MFIAFHNDIAQCLGVSMFMHVSHTDDGKNLGIQKSPSAGKREAERRFF